MSNGHEVIQTTKLQRKEQVVFARVVMVPSNKINEDTKGGPIGRGNYPIDEIKERVERGWTQDQGKRRSVCEKGGGETLYGELSR